MARLTKSQSVDSRAFTDRMGVLLLNRSQRVSLIVVLAVSCAALLALMPGAYGQTAASSATFTGFVEDPSEARVADATVTISNTEEGIKRSFKSDAEGNFSFAQTLLKSGKRSWASSACFLPRMARVKIQTSSIFMSAVSIELSECSE